MLRFSEEIMLLLLDDGDGTFVDLPVQSLEFALAGSVLMDLAMEGRIDTDPERLFVVDRTPIDDDLLEPTFRRITSSMATYNTRDWIQQITPHAGDIRERSLARLVERGVLREEQGRFLWVFHTRRYPVIDNQTLREVKLRIMEVLFTDQIPDSRDIVLIALADVCGIFSSLLSSRELKTVTPRIRQISKLDLIAREVASAVREIESSLAFAMVPIH
jgi:Golgi phosphoprotein 3